MLGTVKKYITFIIVVLLLAISAYFIYVKINPKELAKNLIASSGRIDGDLTLLNTKYPARVDKIFVKEGDAIILGEKIAQLKSNEFISQENSLKEATLSLKKQTLSFKQSINAQSLELQLLEKTLPKLVKMKEDNLKNLENTLISVDLRLEKLDLNVKQNKKDYDRYKKLFASKLVSSEKFELMELKYKTILNEYKTLKIEKTTMSNNIKIAKQSLQIAKDNLIKIDISKQNILASKTKLASLENKIKQSQALKNETKDMIDELSLKSPINGFVIDKIANEGEVIGAGAVVVTLSDTSSYYLKLFVDTLNNGKIKIGDRAVIFLDSYPNRPIPAKVTAIAAKAEFTPKDVSVRSDRIQRVYAVHVRPLKYNPLLKLGIPAIGVITINGEGLPISLHDIPEI